VSGAPEGAAESDASPGGRFAPLELEYTVSERQHTRLYLDAVAGSRRLRVSLGLNVLALVAGVALELGGHDLGVVLIAWGAVFTLLPALALYRGLVRSLARASSTRGRWRTVVDDDGVTDEVAFDGTRVTRQVAWGSLTHSRERRDYYALRGAGIGPVIVPKWAFASPSDEARFVALLESRTTLRRR
jgi:hypothetical protein